MILKPPEKTGKLQQLEVMVRRYLQPSQDVTEAHGRELAGYLGEKSLPYYLNLTFFTSHYDLYGLRLPFNNHYFQKDGFMMFPTFFLITEVKHLKGKLFINQAGQLIQMRESGEKIYQHPLHQADLQKEQLQHLLNNLGYEGIPIYTLATFTHKEANLTFQDPSIIPVQQLPFRIKTLMKESSDFQLTMDSLFQLGKKLISLHQERPLSFSDFSLDDLPKIQRGVFCGKCRSLMNWTYGTWKCRDCRYQDNMRIFLL